MGDPYWFGAQSAAIAALHAEAPSHERTDWAQLAELYRRRRALTPSPTVTIAHAVAVAESHSTTDARQLLHDLKPTTNATSFRLVSGVLDTRASPMKNKLISSPVVGGLLAVNMIYSLMALVADINADVKAALMSLSLGWLALTLSATLRPSRAAQEGRQ